jgi:hypothetical protein
MLLLILFALLLLPIAAFAQSAPLLGLQGAATVLHPSPGTAYLYDQNGNSVTIYRTPYSSWYSSQDSHGRIISDGYLFNAMPQGSPLGLDQFTGNQLSSSRSPVFESPRTDYSWWPNPNRHETVYNFGPVGTTPDVTMDSCENTSGIGVQPSCEHVTPSLPERPASSP